jgi:hypothetical protein
MAWNLRPLRRHLPTGAASAPECAPSAATELSPSARGQLLGIFRRLAAVLHLTADVARSAGKAEQHAAFGARLAIFRARVEAGEASPLLATALARFGEEFKAFVVVDLGFGR